SLSSRWPVGGEMFFLTAPFIEHCVPLAQRQGGERTSGHHINLPLESSQYNTCKQLRHISRKMPHGRNSDRCSCQFIGVGVSQDQSHIGWDGVWVCQRDTS